VVVKTGKKGNKYTVVAKVTVDQQIDVSFKIVEKKGMSWLIVDVTVEGISMVMNWRSTFAELLQHQSLDSVINDLESNNITTKE
jgi:phospholipid transport system substrate-binding protein